MVVSGTFAKYRFSHTYVYLLDSDPVQESPEVRVEDTGEKPLRESLQSRCFETKAHYQQVTHAWLTCDFGVEGDHIPSPCLDVIGGKRVCQ